MKSFGLRLVTGVATIVLAAYVLIISQSDAQKDATDWTAVSNTDQSPAEPLQEDEIELSQLDSGWLKQPTVGTVQNIDTADIDTADLSIPPIAGELPTGEGSPSNEIFEQANVRLVQHEDGEGGQVAPALGTQLPSSLAQQDSDGSFGSGLASSQGGDPDSAWLMPEEKTLEPPAESPSSTLNGFKFPAGISDQGTTSVDALEEGTLLAVPSIPVEANLSSERVGDEDSSETIASVDPKVGSTQASPGQPGNILREGFGETNVLRGGSEGADLGFTLSDETEDTDVPLGRAVEIGSGVAGLQTVPSDFRGGDQSVSSVRLPGAAEMNERPVGNGLRSDPVPADEAGQIASAENVDSQLGVDLTPGGAISTFGSPQVLGGAEVSDQPEEFATGSALGNELFSPSVAGGVEEVATVAPASNALGGSSVLEVAESVPNLGSTSGGSASSALGMNSMNSNADAAAVATMDSPGERRLEGAQTPSVIIQKRAPSEVRVGKAASFVVNVQNVGAADALNVEVYDQVPAGMRFIEASPAPKQIGNQLMWQLGSMAAGEERTITLQLVPELEGELGSVARVSFEAAASVRTLSTKPELKIVQRVPEQGVLIGQQLEIEIEVSNPGSGAAMGVVLQEDVPEGLEHPRGRKLDNLLGTLEPGEVRRQMLRLRAVTPGIVENTIRLVSDDGLETEHTVSVQVVAPDLQLQLMGPSRRFLERPATYELQVANQGTADATNLEIAVHLDRGFTFVSTENEGYYDPNRHAVFWSLAQLPAGSQGIVPLTLLPVEIGQQAIRIEAEGDLGVTVQSQRAMTVEGFAELDFRISNSGGPIEVGAETEYEVVVTNTGSMLDQNVRIQLQLPPGLELISTSGDAGTNGQGLVVFQPILELQPNQMVKHTIRVRGLEAGVHVVQAVVASQQSTVAVKKEESTRVYADR